MSEEALDPRYEPTLRALGESFAHDQLDPIPERLTIAARQAFGWRLIDAQLAELLFDSASDELVGVRGSRPIDDRSGTAPSLSSSCSTAASTAPTRCAAT